MKKITFLLLFLSLFFTVTHTFGQSSDTLSEVPAETVSEVNEVDSALGYTTEIKNEAEESSGFPIEFWHAMIILSFGVLVIGIEVYLIIRERIKTDDVMKYIVVTLIITCTMYLITAGHNNDQIAPAMGLLGTIAGYLLGKGGNQSQVSQETAEDA
ncbi:MAG: hypothetical protein DWQ02_28965 [Bacteroidetes bacterium]|nr:MAG: hypothetical protein DWQ02_28965 [Bacteroidota bacterium]